MILNWTVVPTLTINRQSFCIQILIYLVDSLSSLQNEHNIQNFPVPVYKNIKVFDQLLNKTIRIRHLTKINLHTHIWSLQSFMVIPVPFTVIYTDLLVYAFMKNKSIESDKILKTIISTCTEWPKQFYKYKVIMQWISKKHLKIQQNKNHHIWTGLSQNAVAKFICCCTLDACRLCMFLCASWNTCTSFTKEKKCVATVYK